MLNGCDGDSLLIVSNAGSLDVVSAFYPGVGSCGDFVWDAAPTALEAPSYNQVNPGSFAGDADDFPSDFHGCLLT